MQVTDTAGLDDGLDMQGEDQNVHKVATTHSHNAANQQKLGVLKHLPERAGGAAHRS
jgi:hypothetical protein